MCYASTAMPRTAAKIPSKPQIYTFLLFPMCLCAVLAAGSSLAADSTSLALNSSMSVKRQNGAPGIAESITLQPMSKWSTCFQDGRMNIIFSVYVAQAAGKVFAAIALPEKVSKCAAKKPSLCKTLVACESANLCEKFFPGEMSGREKCLVVLNPSASEQEVTIMVELQSPGNWGAIIFGVVASSCGLLAVMTLGCYADVTALLAKNSKQKSAARISAKTTAPSTPADNESLHHQ